MPVLNLRSRLGAVLAILLAAPGLAQHIEGDLDLLGVSNRISDCGRRTTTRRAPKARRLGLRIGSPMLLCRNLSHLKGF
jgi:hypothetical protein